MEKAKELINQIYLDVKKHYPEFEYRKYDTSDTVYFGQTSRQFPGKNGNGFKFYKEYNRHKVGVKSNLKTGKLDDHVFLLPEQFEQARACIFTLYEIPLTTTSTIQSSIKEFERALIDNGIRLNQNQVQKAQQQGFYRSMILVLPLSLFLLMKWAINQLLELKNMLHSVQTKTKKKMDVLNMIYLKARTLDS